MNINTYILSNGIRLLHVKAAGDVSYCGALINAGTRDEEVQESGYAHLVEHLLFKGTSKYTSKQIINRIENVGGEINAYTTKEETAVYAAFLKQYLDRTFSLVADMVFDSQFQQKTIDKEVDVVLDEIDSYIDSPSDIILDDFEELIFSGNPLGRNILGNRRSLKSVTRDKILKYYRRTYTPDQIVFFVMGNYTKERVWRLAERALGSVPASKRDYEREPIKEYKPISKSVKKGTKQVHIVLGGRSYSQTDADRYAFILLNNILGGDFMSSILNMKLREKEGLVYEVDSNYTPYFETGNWNIYLGCDYSDVEKSLSIIETELAKLCNKELSERALRLAKRRLLSYLTICGENKESWILGAAKQYLNTGVIKQKREVEDSINSVTAADIRRCANEVFNPDYLTVLKYS